MVKIFIQNARSHIEGRFHEDPLVSKQFGEALRTALGYMVPGVEWSPRYKQGLWDGIISLYNRRESSFPTGCLKRVATALHEFHIPFELVDLRERPEKTLEMTTSLEQRGLALFPYQEAAVSAAMRAGRGIIALATGGGKALCVSTPVATPNGWTTMGALRDGDLVFDDNGQPTTVVQAHPVLRGKPCYEVLFSTGEKIIACDEHLWTVRASPAWQKSMPRLTMTTRELYDVMYCGKRLKVGAHMKPYQAARDPKKRAPFFIDSPSALNYGDMEKLPVDPYVLGAWLGDGTSCSGGFTGVDLPIIENIRSAGFTVNQHPSHEQSWGIIKLAATLRALGVLNNKHIPGLYMHASFEQRLSLLQGLMDTDGTVGKHGNSEIALSDAALAEDVLELVRGLGIQASMSVNEAWFNGTRHKDRHRIKFSTCVPVCRLERKAERIVNCKERPTTRRIYIKSITPVESRPVRCITVDSPSRLYLVGKTLIPTHNTFTTCELLCRMGVGPVIVIVPTRSLLKQTHSEFQGALLDKDGQPVKVGMIGDGLCDIVPDGINIMIYHSGLQAFNEKFLEGKQEIVVDELAGEGTKKTTEQLEAEFSVAASALQGAITRTAPALRDLHSARKLAEATLGSSVEGHAQGTVTQKELDKAQAAFEKSDRAVERERSKLVKAERDAEAKARKALTDRTVSLERKASVRDLFARAQGFLVDEAHLASVVIETLGGHAPNAYYRIGLSATPWREDNQEIRIEGALGRKLVDITATELIEGGFLIAPTIFMVRIDHVESSEDYADLYRKHVTNCWQRNYRIKQFAEAFKAAGMPVLILVERVEHGEILQDMIQDSLFVAGSDKGEDDPDSEERDFRKRMLDECEENKLILIATSWAYTGVNVPALSTLILAGSNQSTVTTYQQVGRVLRRHAPSGKNCAVVIDFMDEEPTLHKHAVRRKKVYKHEAAFTVKTVA